MQSETLEKLKKRIRVSASSADSEVEGLIEAAKRELEIAGVYGDVEDPLYFQAVALYCKARYGYDDSSEKFWAAFGALRDSMALSGDYKKEEAAEDGNSTASME